MAKSPSKDSRSPSPSPSPVQSPEPETGVHTPSVSSSSVYSGDTSRTLLPTISESLFQTTSSASNARDASLSPSEPLSPRARQPRANTIPFPTVEDDSSSSSSSSPTTAVGSESSLPTGLAPITTRIGASLSEASSQTKLADIAETGDGAGPERPHSAHEVRDVPPPAPAKRGRVRFNSRSEVGDAVNRFSLPLQDHPINLASLKPPEQTIGKDKIGKDKGRGVGGTRGPKKASFLDPSDAEGDGQGRQTSASLTGNPFGDSRAQTPTGSSTESMQSVAGPEIKAPVPKRPRPSVLRTSSANSFTDEMMYKGANPGPYGGSYDAMDERGKEKNDSARAAHERAQKVAKTVHGSSNDLPLRGYSDGAASPVAGFARVPTGYGRGKRGPSSPLSTESTPGDSGRDIPLMDLNGGGNSKRYQNGGISSESDENEQDSPADKQRKREKHDRRGSAAEAQKLVRAHTLRNNASTVSLPRTPSPQPELVEHGLESGRATPIEERDADDYVPRPEHYRGGVLSNLLKLYNQPAQSHKRYSSLGDSSRATTPASSGQTTPKQKPPKWYNQKSASTTTLANLIEASSQLAAHGAANAKGENTVGGSAEASKKGPKRPGMHSRQQSGGLEKVYDKFKRPRLEEEIRITVHIAETLSRQKYLIRLCRALMAYGAPTHRLEEYMRMTARVLELDVQVLYIPGCMLVSFDDASTHTTEVKLVRTNQGINLGKLKDVHEIYKEVVHDVTGVEEATQRLEGIIREKPKHHKWVLVLVYGFASACVGPFAFESNFIDLPIAFVLGLCLGVLQLIVAPKSDLYANVFEISAAVVTSFLARAFGSINYHGHRLFCFSALAQSSIALILPGYIILCGSLELQSKSIVAGSVRMFYAVIYSLFLGFGITIGTAFYGAMDSNAVSSTTCQNPMSTYVRLVFVPLFTMCLCVINQAKWKQTPVMLIIAFAGYIVNFFTARRFPGNSQISQTLGAFTIGVLGNLYSRLRHGVAAAALLPAIFVQVPSGLAAGGSLLSGLTSANDITNKNGTRNGTTTADSASSATTADLNSVVFNVGYSMIQVAIGISVGLFLSALVVYPFGKRRSGLFSF